MLRRMLCGMVLTLLLESAAAVVRRLAVLLWATKYLCPLSSWSASHLSWWMTRAKTRSKKGTQTC